MNTVTMKASPQLIPIARNIALLTRIRVEYAGSEAISSDVTRTIIVVNASKRLMSENDSGKINKVNS